MHWSSLKYNIELLPNQVEPKQQAAHQFLHPIKKNTSLLADLQSHLEVFQESFSR